MHMGDESVSELLAALSSGRAGAVWSEFLARYSALIMHVVRRRGFEGEAATDCFIHVCGALSDDGFRRLLGFRPDGPARFSTWLMAVVSNLCTDWRRRELGRERPSRSVSRLSELDQQVYRCIYLRGMSRTQCLHVLLPRFPGLTEPQVAEINGRLFALLTPHQRWQLSVRKPALKPIPWGEESEDDEPGWQLEEPGGRPDELAELDEEQRRLQDALAQLPPEQRLLLRLRYEQDLTLSEVARLTRQADPFRANRQIHDALEALARLMGVSRARTDRKNG
jgi:RNA polymerase sigma factor (sigma-70 family)